MWFDIICNCSWAKDFESEYNCVVFSFEDLFSLSAFHFEVLYDILGFHFAVAGNYSDNSLDKFVLVALSS